MTRRRSLTLAMIRRVRNELGISADVLIGHSEKKRHKRVHSGKLDRTSVNSKRQTAAG
jgi:hypothetical protein